jgi:Uma2 family endonuclease
MTQKTRPDIAEWLRSLGNVPLDRIVMDPLPGTADERDLLRLVERDRRLVELIDGTLVEKPVGHKESLIAMRLGVALGNFIYPRRLGYLTGEAGTLRMKSGRVRLPDLAFVSVDDVPGGALPDEPIPELPPTLAVEVVSESNTTEEMRLKTNEYFESGARLVWLVYPKTTTVAVFEGPSVEPARVLGDGDMLDGAPALPGFSILVAEIFAPLTRGL